MIQKSLCAYMNIYILFMVKLSDNRFMNLGGSSLRIYLYPIFLQVSGRVYSVFYIWGGGVLTPPSIQLGCLCLTSLSLKEVPGWCWSTQATAMDVLDNVRHNCGVNILTPTE
jgi:hypothetical protein